MLLYDVFGCAHASINSIFVASLGSGISTLNALPGAVDAESMLPFIVLNIDGTDFIVPVAIPFRRG